MKAKNTARTYEEKVKDARASKYDWDKECEAKREANPIDWAATVEAGKVVFKKSK